MLPYGYVRLGCFRMLSEAQHPQRDNWLCRGQCVERMLRKVCYEEVLVQRALPEKRLVTGEQPKVVLKVHDVPLMRTSEEIGRSLAWLVWQRSLSGDVEGRCDRHVLAAVAVSIKRPISSTCNSPSALGATLSCVHLRSSVLHGCCGERLRSEE